MTAAAHPPEPAWTEGPASPGAVVLIDVASPYREALVRAAREVRLEPCAWRAGGDAPRPAPPPPVLCVAALSGAGAEHAGRVARLRGRFDAAPLVVLASDPDLEQAVGLVRAGAADVIGLPDRAGRVARRALAHRLPPETLVGRSPAMEAVRRQVRRLADVDTGVLLVGETGTGKGEVARALHHASRGRHAPFVHVDCAGLAPGVIESELFGHERGAFTGALARRTGRLEQARDGTVFLDEIAELPFPLQAKLLRALHDRCFERVGGDAPRALRARVVAATHVDLERAVAQGRFRADLLYRLDVARIALPALRERPEDLARLTEHGLARIAVRLGRPRPGVTPALLDALAERDWPGNVRELLNLLERLLVLCDADPLDVSDLRALEEGAGCADGRPAAPQSPGAEPLARVLRETGGNVARAARRLGVPRSTLRARIRRLGLGSLIPRD